MPINPIVAVIPFSSEPFGLSTWQQVGDEIYFLIGDPLDPTTGKLVNPYAIDSPARQIFSRAFFGATLLGIRMRYDQKPASQPLIVLFGRTRRPDGTVGDWQILRNLLGDIAVAITTSPADIVVPTIPLFATTADRQAQFFALQGCNEFLLGVQTTVTGQEYASLDVKFI